MDFNDSPEQAAWRREVREFLEAERESAITPAEAQAHFYTRGESARFRAWREKLAPRGWVAPAWPKEYGGAGLGAMDQFILNEEFAEASVPMIGGQGPTMIGPTIILHGSDEQKRYFLPRILSSEIRWCQGYSEPGSGSDLASLQTRAVRDGDDFVINGQKIWTSGAQTANWMFMLARTDPDAAKHRGISYFLLDMTSPGITIRPLINMADEHHFNEVFFEDVRVPAANVIGEVNRGWYVATTTLDFERSAVGNAVGVRKEVERLVRHARERRQEGLPVRRVELAERWIEATAAKLHSYRVASLQAAGLVPNYEASVAKLFTTELRQRIALTAVRLLGMHGALTGGEGVPMGGRAALGLLGSVSQTIAGGTSEIQRGIIATRGLGLPR